MRSRRVRFNERFLRVCTDGLSEMGKEKLMILKRVAPLGGPANFIPIPKQNVSSRRDEIYFSF